jgi:hypothetical protein
VLAGLCIATGCAKATDDVESSECDASGPPKIKIGTEAGSGFRPLLDGDTVTLATPPQGGVGVPIRILTVGLRTEAPVDVNLISRIRGEDAGEFSLSGVQLRCQSIGYGMVTGAMVGFDPDTYPDDDALIALEGEAIVLSVEVTDTDGDQASSEISVILDTGG